MKKLFIPLCLSGLISFGQDLYDIDQITEIYIEFSASDWDALMDANDLTDDGTKLPGTVTINGSVYDSVGVAYKGNSSYDASNAKNPLNIELNYILNQRYQGYTTLKLASGKNDPSFVREVLCYEMGRKYMDMPLSNYAKVYINGAYYGLFSSTEAIDGRYGERRLYADKDNPRFKCNPPYGMGPGNEPNLIYYGTDSALYDTRYELKTTYGWAPFIDFMNQLANNTANIETYLDVDRTLWMLAFNNVTANMDSYSGPTKQNYYMIQDDNGRWCPIIWDQNEGIGGFENVGVGPPGPPDLADLTDMDMYLRQGDVNWPLISELLAIPRYKKMYVAHMRTIVAENISNNWYHTRALELQAIIDAEQQAEPNGWYPHTDFVNNVDNQVTGMSGAFGIAEVLDGREAYLNTQTDWNLTAPAITSPVISPAVVPANTLVTFTVDVTNTNYVYLGYREFAGDAFAKTQMFDDGAHGDGAASDGMFGVTIFAGATDLQYYFYAENNDAAIFSPERAEHEFYYLVVDADVVINEVMPKNNVTATDEEGKYEDWIELYNNTSSAIDLTGYYLSDDISNPNKWQFPDTSIAANGYLIIWCDEDTLDAGLHTNFKLTSGGEVIVLSNSSGFSVNQVTMPEIESSSTYGRYVNGTGSFIRMVPTFNAENSYTALTVDEDIKTEFSVYPNPANDMIYIVTGSDAPVDYQLYNLQGELVYSGQIENNSSLNISSLQSGTYIIYLPLTGEVNKLMKH
ncbi:MAG: CotH kinase family protein [Crocinitomicaceae bacterium]|nr:CotH kinase family protein [Crocinitomicaceae bacterium]